MKREIEHRWRELGEFVREQRRLGQLSLRRLSELSGISNPYLSQIERGLRRPSAEILQQLARALQISAETLYVRAGILEDRHDGDPVVGGVVSAIRGARELTEEHKRALIRIYQSFRAEGAEGAARDRSPAQAVSTTEAEAASGGESASGFEAVAEAAGTRSDWWRESSPELGG